LKSLHRDCPGVNQDGTPCRSSVILDSGRCISHPDPNDAEAVERKMRAVNAGAAATQAGFDPDAADPHLDTPRAVVRRAAWVSGAVRRREVSYAEAEVHLAAARVALDAGLGDRRVKIVERGPSTHGIAVEIDPNTGVVRVVIARTSAAELAANGDVIEAER
jgi:hypothetical protein